MTLSVDDPRHGTVAGYRRECRCVPCVAARAEYDRLYRAANVEKLREKNAKYYADNIDRERASRVKYRAAHPRDVEKERARGAKYLAENGEKIRERQAKYRAVNREKVRERTARWYTDNPERARANRVRWQAMNRGKTHAASAKWKAANPEKSRASWQKRRARKFAQFVEDVDHAVVWARDGGICHICGLPVDPAKWDLDHIVPLVLGGEHSMVNVAVSHQFCNRSKGGRPWPTPSEPATQGRGCEGMDQG